MNGSELKLGGDDALPSLTGVSTASGQVTFASGYDYIPRDSERKQCELPLIPCFMDTRNVPAYIRLWHAFYYLSRTLKILEKIA